MISNRFYLLALLLIFLVANLQAQNATTHYVITKTGYMQGHVIMLDNKVGSSRVDLQACKLEYSIVSPK